MDFQLSCASTLAQIWAIEALARSNHVKPSLLLDLLKKIPKNSNHIGKNTMESVSLKFLESLFIQGARANPASALSKTVRLHPSDHCEDVLRRILNEISQSHLKPAGLEISKWDLEPFIEHKKSNLPKCALEQLKDAILTGNPSVPSFLKERSGLLVGSHAQDQAASNDSKRNENIPRAEGSDTDDADGSSVAASKRRRASVSPAEQFCETLMNPAKKSKNAVISNECVGEQLISSGVDKQISNASTVAVQNIEEKRFHLERKTNVGNMGILEPSKNDNTEGTSSGLGERDNVLPCGGQVYNCDTELNNESEEQQRQDQSIKDSGKNEICDLKKTNGNLDLYVNNADEVDESVHVYDDNDGNDDVKTSTTRKEISSCSPHYTTIEDSLETANSRGKSVLADTSERCSLEEESCVEVMRQIGSLGGGNDQRNSSKGLVGNVQIPHCGTKELNEKLDVTMHNCKSENTENRRNCFHGLLLSNEDIDKFGQSVPRTVSTVGEAEDVNISNDIDGYYDERTTIDTKKKTFLSSQGTYSEDPSARSDLRELHLCMKCNKGGNVLSCASESCPIVIHEICLGSDESLDARELFYCPFCAYSQSISKYMDVKKSASLARQNLTTFICLGPQNESSKQPQRSLREDGNCLRQNDGLPKGSELNQSNGLEKVSNHQVCKKLEFEQVGHSALHSDHCPPFGRKAVVSTGILVQSSKGDKQDVRRMSEESQQPIAADAIHISEGETTFYQVSETSGSEKHGEIRSTKSVPHPPETDLPCERKCSQSSQSTDEISEYENEDSGASKCFIKVREQGGQNLHPANPQMRRKRIRWTRIEEDALKEGIRVHCSPNSRVIPWKSILDHGKGKFQPSRSAMDLKGKWRNMCKASPKSK